MEGLCKVKAEQSAECLSKSMEAMTLLADRQKDPIYFALTGASVRATAKTELGLRYGLLCYHSMDIKLLHSEMS